MKYIVSKTSYRFRILQKVLFVFVFACIGALSSTSLAHAVDSKFNLSGASAVVSGWTNVTGDPRAAVRSATDGVTGFGLRSITTYWDASAGSNAFNGRGESVDDGGGFAFPAAAMVNYWFNAALFTSNQYNFQLFGLDTGKTYTLTFLGSRNNVAASPPYVTDYNVRGSTTLPVQTLDAYRNTSEVVVFSNVVPNGSGVIDVAVSRKADGTGGPYAFINAVQIEEDVALNVPPNANAGSDQNITQPTTTTTLSGSGSTDSDGTITTYAWTFISGPVTPSITSASTVSTGITGMTTTGTYVFRLTVTDDATDTDTDDVHVVVAAEPSINKQFNYQGKLTDASDEIVPDGSYNMEFKLYTESSGGSAIWTETRTSGDKIQVQNGLFSVMLGEVSVLDSIDFNQTLYLGVNIGGTGSPSWDGEMTPRKKLGAVPAAMEAAKLGGASASQYLRSDQTSTLSATDNILTAFTVAQLGTGNIFDVKDSSTTVFTILDGGNVGIGDSTPASLFTVGSGDLFQVNSSGAITAGSITSGFGAIDVGADNITTTGIVLGNGFDRTTTGAVGFGNTNASSVSICNSTNCDTIQIGTSTDADQITIGETNDTITITGGASSAFVMSGVSVSSAELGVLDGGVLLNEISSATATRTLSNANFMQEWQWNTLAGGTGFRLSSTSTGAASNTQRLFEVLLSGANTTTTQTTYAGSFSNTHTGTSSTNVGLFVTASGGTNNYAALFGAGNVGIGNIAPATLLHVGGTSSTDGTNLLRLEDANSTCNFTADTGSPACGSDRTLKKDIESLNTKDLLQKVSVLNPVSYRWATDEETIPLQYGFIAQEVAEQFPNLVTENTWVDGTTRMFLNTGGMMPYVVGAIKEMNVRIQALPTFEDDTFTVRLAEFLRGIAERSEAIIESVKTKKIQTEQLCVGDEESQVCVTKDQLQTILNNSVGSGGNPELPPVDEGTPSEDTTTGTEGEEVGDDDTGETPEVEEDEPTTTPDPSPSVPSEPDNSSDASAPSSEEE